MSVMNIAMSVMNIVDLVLCPLLVADIVIGLMLWRQRNKPEGRHACRNMSSDAPSVLRKRR